MPAPMRGRGKEDHGQGEAGETNSLVAAARGHLTGSPSPQGPHRNSGAGSGGARTWHAAVVCWSWSFFTSSQAHGYIVRDSRELVMKPPAH